MRKVMLKIHCSLDGYVRGPDGDVMDWVFQTYDDELQQWEVATLGAAGTHIMGRKLYEEMAAYWPTSTEPFAPPMNEIPKVVFSHTTTESDWNATQFASGDLAEEIERLKREPGKPILLHGGPTFIRALAERDLIDEYHILVHPVVLSGGLPLFTKPMNLKLLGSTAFPAGAVLLTYGRAASRSAE